MSYRLTVAAFAGTFFLAACGGGGGGGGTGDTQVGGGATQTVVISETNARPLAASALGNVMDASATSVTGLPMAAPADGSAALGGVGALQAISASAQRAASSIAGSQLPVGVAVNQSVPCAGGGSMTVTGTVANTSVIQAGDTLTIVNNNCRTSEAGVMVTLNGQVNINVVSGVLGNFPFRVVMQSTVTNLSVQAGNDTVLSNGDARIDWSATSATSQTILATGNSLTTRETTAGVTRTNALRSYSQGLTFSGSLLTATLSGRIETDNAQLGVSASNYVVSTPVAVSWDSGTGVVNSGVVKVQGANNGQMTLTFSGNNNGLIQIDANGDGNFERSISTNLAELSNWM